ncbi:MAG: sulfate permease [Candidatus Omnitrophica bacterium]|nr:sulfate permease [Candidatus Omnitrophota bacterium]
MGTLKPKLFTTLKDYSKAQFLSDTIAGLVVGVVAIPLAIAFAIASGLSPEKGLFTAVVAGILISALGGSRVQIGGPTGAFVIIVYGIVQKYGVDGLVFATLLAGVLLILMGYAKLGTIIKYIPHSVIVGFTSGIAVVIFSSQIKDFFGLSMEALPADFIGKWKVMFANIRTVNLYSLAVALFTVLVIACWPRISRRIPGSLVALVVTSVVVSIFQWPVETIGARFGDLPHALPAPQLPVLSWDRVQGLLHPAFTLALLGAIESLLSAVVSDGMIGGRHRPNMELIAQGAANIGSSLLGGMPATGAVARTVTNIKNGGRTPIAGIVHAITVLLALLFLGHWLKHIPLACLAGILVVVSYHMSEWRSFKELLKTTRGGVLVLLSTFFLTVLVDLTVAIEIGMVLSAFLFVKRMAEISEVKFIAREIADDESGEESPIQKIEIPKGVEVYEIKGPFFFGIANKFEEAVRIVAQKPKVRILRLRDVPVMDSTGLYALRSFYHKSKHSGIHLLIAGLHVQPLNEVVKSNLYDLIGEENVLPNIKEALQRANQLIA